MKTILPYDKTHFRVSENYLMPDAPVGGLSRTAFEQTLAKHGVQARWVGVYDHGGPRFRSAFIPISARIKGDLTAKLNRQIDLIHKAGMTAITWCSPFYGESAWKAHRSWRIVHMDRRDPGAKASCCINSPYGDALIGMSLEFFQKFDLDGVFFDGAWFGGATRPTPACVCVHCQKKFKSETGYSLPKVVDFKSPAFRAWVHWRFTMLAAYLKKLVDSIHAQYPDKVITINHYHRYDPKAWHTACPLDTYDCSIVTGTEAMMHMDHASLSSKMAVAYGRPVDVWTPLSRWRIGKKWQLHEPAALMHHAACCLSFGAIPSFGYETGVPEGSVPASVHSFLKPMADFLRKRARYVNLPSANPIALHLSQQTETFYFGRRTGDKGFGWYWESLFGWDQLLNETGLGTDVIFDSHLTAERLARYKVVVLPLSLAISTPQAQALREYVAGGGTLILGPWAGRLDAEGEAASPPPLRDLRATNEAAAPDANAFRRNSMYLTKHMPVLPDIHGFAMHTMVAEQTPRKGSVVLMSCGEIDGVSDGLNVIYGPARKDSAPKRAGVTQRRLGRGVVIDLATDWGASFYYAPSSPMRRVLMSLIETHTHLPFRVQAPPCVTASWRREPDGAYLVHLHNCPVTTHHQGHEAGDYYMPIIPRDIIPITDVQIEVAGRASLKATRLAEQPGTLHVSRKGQRSVINVGRLALHEVVRIQ